MSGSKYAYVKSYETPDNLLPGTFIVVRLDGHAFHKYVSIRLSVHCQLTNIGEV